MSAATDRADDFRPNPDFYAAADVLVTVCMRSFEPGRTFGIYDLRNLAVSCPDLASAIRGVLSIGNGLSMQQPLKRIAAALRSRSGRIYGDVRFLAIADGAETSFRFVEAVEDPKLTDSACSSGIKRILELLLEIKATLAERSTT